MRVSYDFQAKKGESYWILLRYSGTKRGIRDSGSKKIFSTVESRTVKLNKKQ